jgi:hypothetical protein
VSSQIKERARGSKNGQPFRINRKEYMQTKVEIKVIKKYAVKSCETLVVLEKNPSKKADREIVSTISDWVSEFQKRRHKETKQALNLQFTK